MRLRNLGYFTGDIDAEGLDALAHAVRAFQPDQKDLPIDGKRAGATNAEAVDSSKTLVRARDRGSSAPDVDPPATGVEGREAGVPLDEKLRQAYFWIVNNAIISPH